MMENGLLFELKNVGLCYRRTATLPWRQNRFWALRDVSFTISRGETMGIIGRNGAGKSSLLKIIAGIIEPDAGSIWRAPVTTTILSFGAGFEQRLTGRQNIMLNGLQLGMSKDYVHSRMDQIVELADIGRFIDQPVKTYSTGMKARLGFSIALFIETDVLLIDEALATGDEMFRKNASELIKEKIRSDLTVVLVSHSMLLVKELCNRVIQIESGQSLPELELDHTIDRFRQTAHKPTAPVVQTRPVATEPSAVEVPV